MTTGITRLLEVMARLRDPAGGCPWDREQTFATIAPYTIEEAYEVADAIERGDMDALRDELGDLLFQVVFYAQMAAERGAFDFDAVAAHEAEKMTRRHPHVFGGAEVADSETQTRAWEAHKARERAASGETGTLSGVARALPALMRAEKLTSRAARVGFDWEDTGDVIAKIEEELGEVRREIADSAPRTRLEDEIGDLLFAVANLARKLGVDPEAALRGTNAKFTRRFRAIEHALAAEGRAPDDATLEEMDVLWNDAKAAEPDRD